MRTGMLDSRFDPPTRRYMKESSRTMRTRYRSYVLSNVRCETQEENEPLFRMFNVSALNFVLRTRYTLYYYFKDV